jgi:hypothetical protein
MGRWLGTINHASITATELDAAMKFFDPLLDFLGCTQREKGRHAGTRVAIKRVVTRLGGTILDGPGEFPFGLYGCYAVYFLGPDALERELVRKPALAPFYEQG